MGAQLLARAKEVRDDGSIVEVVVWRVPRAIHPCIHPFKYRLYFGAAGVCRVRYDNEQGKGDHRHTGESEEPIASNRWNNCWLISSAMLKPGDPPHESHH